MCVRRSASVSGLRRIKWDQRTAGRMQIHQSRYSLDQKEGCLSSRAVDGLLGGVIDHHKCIEIPKTPPPRRELSSNTKAFWTNPAT
jgi:hypothetical protein